MQTLYVYSLENNEVVAKVTGDTNATCEKYADDNYGSNDYGWTYSPAFGANDGLVDSSKAKEVTLN